MTKHPIIYIMCCLLAFSACSGDDDIVPGVNTDECRHQLKVTVPSNSNNEKNILPPWEGYSQFLIVTSGSEDGDCSWVIDIDTTSAKWIHLDKLEGTGTTLVTFDYDENKSASKRTAQLTISDKDNPSLKRQLLFRQETETNATSTGDMQAKHGMGYGYNITGYASSDKSFGMNPIIDYAKAVKLEEDRHISIITEEQRHVEKLEIASGNTYSQVMSELTKKSETTNKVWGTSKEIKKYFSDNKRADQICAQIRLNEIASSRTIDMGSVNALIAENPNLILTDAFLAALGKLKDSNKDDDFAEFFLNYGTHLVVSADLGASLTLSLTSDRDTLFTHREITEHTVEYRVGIPISSNTKSEITDNKYFNLHVDYTINMEGGGKDSRDAIKKTLEGKGKIPETEILAWQQSLRSGDGELNGENLALVSQRLLPIYDLIPNIDLRVKMFNHLKRYIAAANMSDDQIDCDKGFDNFRSCDLTHVLDDTKLAFGKYGDEYKYMVASEYIAELSEEKPVTVVYPMINGRPYLNSGLFLGDKDHRPGEIRWYDTQATYTPNDSVCYTDSRFASLFNENYQLRYVYCYFHDINILPFELFESMTADNLPTEAGAMAGYVKMGRRYWLRTPELVEEKQRAFNVTTGLYPYFMHEADVKKDNLPTTEDFVKLLKAIPYRLLHDGAEGDDLKEQGVLGIHWPEGLYVADTKNHTYNKEKSLKDDYFYLPTYYRGGIRITRLSPSNNAPCYPRQLFLDDGTENAIVYAPIYVMQYPKP